MMTNTKRLQSIADRLQALCISHVICGKTFLYQGMM